MPFGFVVSLLLHVGILTWALIGFSTAKPLKMPDEVPVEVSIISQIDLETKQKRGDSLSKLEEAAKSEGKQPTPKDAPKPKPVRAVEPPPAATAEPPPPPPEPVKAPEPPPPPPPKAPDQIAALIEKPPAPAPPPVADGPTPEEKKLLEEKLAEQQRQDEAKAKAEAEARAKAEADAKARAEAERKAAEKKKADDLKKKLAEDKKKKEEAEKKKAADLAKKSKSFDQQMADLLNKVPDQPSASQGADTAPVKPTSAKGPTAGTKTGNDNVNKAKAEQMLGAILNSAFKECWSKPSAGGGVSAPAVRLKWSLNQDGTLSGEPKVIQSDHSSPLAEQAERAAIRAVQTCVPFQLPPEHYNLWRVIDWNFNPNQP